MGKIPISVKRGWPEMHMSGLSLNQISLKSNCSAQSVSNYLYSLGVKTNTRVINNKIRRKWPQLYLDGLSYEDISKKFKCANMTVYNYIKKSGIKTRSNRESHTGKGAGFRVDAIGYVRCTRKGENCGKFMHRLIFEKHLCRSLTKKEVIHHIDGDKANNDIKNLMLFSCQAEHRKFHKKT